MMIPALLPALDRATLTPFVRQALGSATAEVVAWTISPLHSSPGPRPQRSVYRVAGTARLLLGGPNGLEITVKPGDCALLPAGTGHCRLEGSADFLVVGGYPPNQPWDLCREAIGEAAKREMAKVPFPNSDPVLGAAGPLLEFWSRAA